MTDQDLHIHKLERFRNQAALDVACSAFVVLVALAYLLWPSSAAASGPSGAGNFIVYCPGPWKFKNVDVVQERSRYAIRVHIYDRWTPVIFPDNCIWVGPTRGKKS